MYDILIINSSYRTLLILQVDYEIVGNDTLLIISNFLFYNLSFNGWLVSSHHIAIIDSSDPPLKLIET
jgi:hypothetical protein